MVGSIWFQSVCTYFRLIPAEHMRTVWWWWSETQHINMYTHIANIFRIHTCSLRELLYTCSSTQTHKHTLPNKHAPASMSTCCEILMWFDGRKMTTIISMLPYVASNILLTLAHTQTDVRIICLTYIIRFVLLRAVRVRQSSVCGRLGHFLASHRSASQRLSVSTHITCHAQSSHTCSTRTSSAGLLAPANAYVPTVCKHMSVYIWSQHIVQCALLFASAPSAVYILHRRECDTVQTLRRKTTFTGYDECQCMQLDQMWENIWQLIEFCSKIQHNCNMKNCALRLPIFENRPDIVLPKPPSRRPWNIISSFMQH